MAADDVLGLNDGLHNGASEKLDPAQSEPQNILATKGGSNVSPTLVTIQCSLEITQPQTPPTSVIGVMGFLDWGINGCSHVAKFDWLQGCAFTLTATSFKLRAKLRNGLSPGTYVKAGASIAYGTKPVVPLQLTTDYVTLVSNNGGASTIFDIPPWATHGLLVATPFSALLARGILVEVLTFTNVLRYDLRPGDCTEANRFPLSFDVQRVRVTNQSDEGPVNVAIIWRLTL
ncbi:MAG TPA: hypothetical protein PK156_19050 [Polyangium sp.]|nr:hypothetical protein [Polyangium sp.]